MDNNLFGCTKYCIDGRTFGIDEMKKYYFYPADVRNMFLIFCEHLAASRMYFTQSKAMVYAIIESPEGYIKFNPIKEDELEASGLIMFNNIEFADMLRKDNKEGKNTWDYVRKIK